MSIYLRGKGYVAGRKGSGRTGDVFLLSKMASDLLPDGLRQAVREAAKDAGDCECRLFRKNFRVEEGRIVQKDIKFDFM